MLANTEFLLLMHAPFGHSQSPGALAFLAAPQEGHEAFLPKTILVWLMHPLLGQDQSSSLSPDCEDASELGRPERVPPPLPKPQPLPPPYGAKPPKTPSCGLGAPHFGQLVRLPKTIFWLLMQLAFGHLQSLGPAMLIWSADPDRAATLALALPLTPRSP